MTYWNRRIINPEFIDEDGKVRTKIPYTKPPTTSYIAVATNSIKLSSSASSQDNFYVGYDIILYKTLPNGKQYTQKKRITAYKGNTRLAIIDDVWDTNYEPEQGDTYKIVLSYPDMRVTTNPAMQTFDYITSVRYGRGLDPEKDFYLNTVRDTARKCDARSDVSLKTATKVTVTDGAVYRLTYSGSIIWEGEVRLSDSNTNYVLFTNVIGKITNKWLSWKSYALGEVVYNNNKFYIVTSPGPKSAPNHSSGTFGGLQYISSLDITKISGTGPTTISLDLSDNPVLALNEDGEEISGYTLYDSDSIDYWRRLGWDTHSQDSATLYQTNFTIDTSVPMFDNINMMLEHYNGIFSYSQGKYAFGIEEAENEYVQVTEDDIVGKISFEDIGSKKAFNSVSVSYSDPANNFESKNISLFSGKFLKQDRNVPKKGNITIVGITNYYNVRLLADSYLKRSRMGSVIKLTLYPEFITLVAGSVIGINYKRFNWSNKPFRVESLTIEKNNLITIVAEEYHDSFYSLTNMNKVDGVGKRGSTVFTPLSAPTNLVATNTSNNNELKDGILLKWTNATGLNPATYIEIYASDTSASELTITSITSGNTVNFSQNHGLKVGSSIKIVNSGNGLIAGNTYFVTDVVDNSNVRLSSSLGGSVETLSIGSSLNIKVSTYNLVGTVSYPETQFLHTFANITDSVTKFYKIRYRVQK